MKYLIKNKTTKNIVLNVDGGTRFLYPKNKQNDNLVVNLLTPQLKNLKKLRFIQITKIDKRQGG